MKKKIIFLLPNLHYGGAAKVITTIAEGLNHHHFDVIIAVVNLKDQFFRITNPKVRLIDINKEHVRSIVPELRSLIKKEKPDIVFSNGQDLNILSAIFLKLFNKKLIHIARETSVLSANNKNHPLKKIYKILIKKCYPRINKIICQSGEMKNDFIKHFNLPENLLKVIPNPVSKPPRNDFHTLKNSSKCIFLSIGRLVPEKGNMRLIHALANIHEPFEFIIIGDGPEMKLLQEEATKKGISDKVKFTGRVSDIYQYIELCNFVLTGTYSEGFPNIVIESGIMGKPVIAFKVPGVSEEVIVQNETGILVESDRVEDFTEAIIKAMRMKFDASKIAAFITSKHGTNTIIKQYEDLFLSL